MSSGDALVKAVEAARDLYTEKRPHSLASFEESTAFMPGGNTRTVLYHDPFPFRAAKGEGAWLYDIDNNRMLNLLGEYTAGLFGHDHPAIRTAIERAMATGLNLGAHNMLECHFAELVCTRFPSIEKVRFTNSGTEANMMAITAARAFTGREAILVFEGGYHGGPFLFKPGITTNAPFPWVMVPYNDTEAAMAAIREHGDSLAAVIVEPMLGSGGAIPGTSEFLTALRQGCDETGALLIFDEVMTSRLGRGGAQSLLDIKADITTLGKWIGGGMSFGAFGGRSDILDQFDPRRADAIAHAGTFNNNVLTMAAGTTALDTIYTADVAEEFTARGDALRDRLNLIAREEEVPVVFSGSGSLMNLHPMAECPVDYAGTGRADDGLRELLFLDLLDQGYYIARRGFMALSLALDDAGLAAFCLTLRAILRERAALLRDVAEG